jgi:Spy/CpxP family protein refolding chaperone
MGGGMRRMQEVNKKVMDQLNLTADQKKKVDELQKKTQTKMEGLRKEFKPGGDNAGLRDKFMAINQEHRKALMAILNADQKKKYETLMKAEMEKFRQNRGQNGQGGPGQGGARRRNGAGGGAGRPNGGSNGGGL